MMSSFSSNLRKARSIIKAGRERYSPRIYTLDPKLSLGAACVTRLSREDTENPICFVLNMHGRI